MLIIGCDYHPGFQQIAFVDTETGECGERRLAHREEAEQFYREHKQQSVRVGMEASGHARWFERLLGELQFELWIGDAAEIRTKRVRKQKTDRQDAQLLLRLMLEDRFPRIWVPDAENRDLRQLLWHRHRLVQMRTRVMNQLHVVALNEGLRRKKALWRPAGRQELESFALARWASRRRQDLLDLFDQLTPKIQELTHALEDVVEKRPVTRRLMTHPGVGPLTALAFELVSCMLLILLEGLDRGATSFPVKMTWGMSRDWEGQKEGSLDESEEFVSESLPALWSNGNIVPRLGGRAPDPNVVPLGGGSLHRYPPGARLASTNSKAYAARRRWKKFIWFAMTHRRARSLCLMI
jgi:hypothetical protein